MSSRGMSTKKGNGLFFFLMIENKVGFSIGCDPPIYIEDGGVIPVANVSKI